MNNVEDELKSLCVRAFGVAPSGFESIPAAGGDRRFSRIHLPMTDHGTPSSVIGVYDPDRYEAQAFVDLSEFFVERNVNVPEIYLHSDDFHCYLEQDLGNRSLFSLLGSPRAEELVEKTMRELVKMQTCCSDSIEDLYDPTIYGPFYAREAMWDLNYFKYEFLKNSGVFFNEDLLEDDFEKIAAKVQKYSIDHPAFMMRDCQSRNVMIVGDDNPQPYFIDFQAGREGPGLYDAVSFLWQAKAGFSSDFRQKMLRVYADAYSEATGVDADDILSHVPLFALFRTLQVLGAYGFRGLVQRRAHFIESIPGALENLRQLFESGAIGEYYELSKVVGRLLDSSRFKPAPVDGKLHVKVFSFSYKRGYPEDLTGNGGGFMFDCRGMHNPGRYEEYKQLTGLDAPVIDFLKERGEIDPFVERAVEMVAPTVERYLKRGFSSLQIGFGCTGGRHRSVYSAEAAANRLAEMFPDAVIDLCHREQNIIRTFNA